MELKQTLAHQISKFEKSLRSTHMMETQKQMVQYLTLRLRRVLEQWLQCNDAEEALRIQGSARVLNDLIKILSDSQYDLEKEMTNVG